MRIWPSLIIALFIHGMLLALPVPKPPIEASRLNDILFVLVSPLPNDSDQEPVQGNLPEPLPKQPPLPAAPKHSPETKPMPASMFKTAAVSLPPKPQPAVESAPDKTFFPAPQAMVEPPDTASLSQVVEQQTRTMPHEPVRTAFGETEGPRFNKRVSPTYPMRARRMGREGVVVLELHIAADGRLLEAILLEKAGYGMDEAALQAIQRSTFFPSTREGRPVASRARLNIRFQLQE